MTVWDATVAFYFYLCIIATARFVKQRHELWLIREDGRLWIERMAAKEEFFGGDCTAGSEVAFWNSFRGERS